MTRLLCDKIETIEPGFGIEMMTLAATVAEPLAPKQAIAALVAEPEPDVSGLIDTPDQSRRRRAPLSRRARRERRARSARCAISPALAPETGAGLAGPLAAARAASSPPRTDRDGRASSRSPARRLHLARCAPPREAGRRARARLRRMVEARCRAERSPRLLSSRTMPASGIGSSAPAMARIPMTGSQRWFLHGIFG